MGLQAALLTSAALTVEVNTLKEASSSLKTSSAVPRSSSRTGKVSNTVLNLYLTEKDFGCNRNNKDNVGTAEATNEVATLKEAVSTAECNAAAERAKREKQEARVAEVQQELQDLVKKMRAWSVTRRLESLSLQRLLRVPKPLRPKPTRPSRKSRR